MLSAMIQEVRTQKLSDVGLTHKAMCWSVWCLVWFIDYSFFSPRVVHDVATDK